MNRRVLKSVFPLLLAGVALFCAASFAQTLALEQARGMLFQHQYTQAEVLLRQQAIGPVRDTMLAQAIIGVRDDSPPLTAQRLNEAFVLLLRASDAGYAEAVYPLAIVYGLLGQPARTQELLLPRAQQNDGRALYLLGRMADLMRDYPRAAQFYERGALTGNADALNGMGSLYANGLGVVANADRAANYYMQAIIAGSVQAGMNLVALADAKQFDLAPEYRKVLLERAALSGDSQARQLLAQASAPKVTAQTNDTIRAARDQKPAPAPTVAAAVAQTAAPVVTPPQAAAPTATPTAAPAAPSLATPPIASATAASAPVAFATSPPAQPIPATASTTASTTTAAAAAAKPPAPAAVPAPAAAPKPPLMDAAQAEQAYAQAMRLRRGQGMNRDLAQSAALLERAAQAGFAQAQLALAEAYEFGLGIAADAAKAQALRQEVARTQPDLLKSPAAKEAIAVAAPPVAPTLSAEQAKVTYDQAVRLRRGDGVMRDFARSTTLLQQAAEAGLAEAKQALAESYEYGLGVPADPRRAAALRQAALR
jgi:TPR repeat protein